MRSEDHDKPLMATVHLPLHEKHFPLCCLVKERWAMKTLQKAFLFAK